MSERKREFSDDKQLPLQVLEKPREGEIDQPGPGSEPTSVEARGGYQQYGREQNNLPNEVTI